MSEETHKQYIQRMTGTEGELFKPTGFISLQRHSYRNKKMLFVKCYTGCIYKKGQPIAKFWMTPEEAVHLAWLLLDNTRIWQK